MSWRFLLAAIVGASFANSASAQPQLGAPPRPAYSPYLNLVRPGASPALNYYGLVRPEVQARQSIQNLQGAVVTNQQAIGALQTEGADLPVTGHQATFMNHGSYFLTGGAGPATGGGRPTGPSLSSGFNRAPRR